MADCQQTQSEIIIDPVTPPIVAVFHWTALDRVQLTAIDRRTAAPVGSVLTHQDQQHCRMDLNVSIKLGSSTAATNINQVGSKSGSISTGPYCSTFNTIL